MSELSKDDALYEWTDPDGTPLKITMLPSGNPELFGQRTPVAMRTPMWLCAPGYYAYRELVRLSRATQPNNAALEAALALVKNERDQAIETLHLINGHSYDRKVVPGQEWTRQWLEGYVAAKGDVDDLIESRHETKEIWPGEEVQP